MTHDEWRPIGLDGTEDGIGIPFATEKAYPPPLQHGLSGSPSAELGEGDKVVLWFLALIAVIHGTPLVALVWQIVTQP